MNNLLPYLKYFHISRARKTHSSLNLWCYDLRGEDWEDHGFRPAPEKNFQRPVSTNGWVWWCPRHPTTWGSTNRTEVEASLGIKQ
jgi:hypothetical protein